MRTIPWGSKKLLFYDFVFNKFFRKSDKRLTLNGWTSVKKKKIKQKVGIFGLLKQKPNLLRLLKKKIVLCKILRFERKLRCRFRRGFFFIFSNVFKSKTKLPFNFKKRYLKFFHAPGYIITKNEWKTRTKFSKFFVLKKTVIKLFFFFYKRWRFFKKFYWLADFIKIVCLLFFFTKAELLPELVAKTIIKQRFFLKNLKTFQYLLQKFFGVFCTYPVYSALRLRVFGKLAGQRKRKFRMLLLKVGHLSATQTQTSFLDYFFKGIWNYIGSFGLKSWVFRNFVH